MSPSSLTAEHWAAEVMQALERLKLESELAFPRFLDLPTELRIVVYEHHFRDSGPDGDTRIAPKSHPRTLHGTAILCASRLVFQEALPIFYRYATLTLDLDPACHENVKDFAYLLEHRLPPGLNFKGEVEQLEGFRHVHVTLSTSKAAIAQRSAANGEGKAVVAPGTRWQHIVPILYSTLSQLYTYRIPQVTIALNIGDIISPPPPPTAGTNTRPKPTFASYVSNPLFLVDGWLDYHRRAKQQPPRSSLTDEELKARGSGRRYRRNPPEVREIRALMHAIFWMGSIVESERAKGTVAELRLERAGDRREGVVVRSDKLPHLVDTARKLVGAGEGKGEDEREGGSKEVWLVLGPPKVMDG